MYKKNVGNILIILFRCISLILPLIVLLSMITLFYNSNYDIIGNIYIKYFFVLLMVEIIYLIFTIILYINSKNEIKKKISKIFLIIATSIIFVQFLTIGGFKTKNEIIVNQILNVGNESYELYHGNLYNYNYVVSGRDLKKIIDKINYMGKGDIITSNDTIDENSSYYLHVEDVPYIDKVIIEKVVNDNKNIE